jgi:tetratricopeptide (TPR) repeat protein
VQTRVIWAVAASALLALAVWPFVQTHRAQAYERDPIMALTPAPVSDSYLREDAVIHDFEKNDNAKEGLLLPRLLSAAYMQRYREKGDVGDLLRAQNEAQKSLAIQTAGNLAGYVSLASADTGLHRFREAIAAVHDARIFASQETEIANVTASNEIELGDYAAAKKLLDGISADDRTSVGVEVTQARYDELMNDTSDAKHLVGRAMHLVDSISDSPAENRAWYHFRLGEIDFETGDNAGAVAEANASLADFPNYWHAETVLAREYAAQHDWKDALAAASIADKFAPLPETVGIESDAQYALGDAAAGAAARDEIYAIEKVGNAQHLSDRLLAVYYDDHDLKLDDAYAIAMRELAVRDDVFTEDTIAWAAAKVGKWDEAQRAIAKAIRYDTPDPRMHYHAGVIAQHFGRTEDAKREFNRALALNPQFHPTFADDARARLKTL